MTRSPRIRSRGLGTASDTPEKHDEARTSERFRPVYQMFGAPEDWDHHAGAASKQAAAVTELFTASGRFAHQMTRKDQARIDRVLSFTQVGATEAGAGSDSTDQTLKATG